MRIAKKTTPLLAAILGLAIGCAGDGETSKNEPAKTDPAATEPSAAPSGDVDASVAALIAATGDGAPFVLVVDDKGWVAARDRLFERFEGPVPRELEELQSASDAPAVLAALAGRFDLELPAPNWEGRDASRPVVLSMMEAPFDGPAGAAIAQMSPLDRRHFPLRHQVVIPASDRAALMKSLRAWVGDKAKELPELVGGIDGAVGFSVKRQWPTQRFVALVPEENHVRVVVLDHAMGFDDPKQLRPWLEAPSDTLPDTPALRHLAGAKQPVGILMRPWQLRALGAALGMYEARRAIDTVSGAYRHAAMAKGTAIAAVIEVLTPDTHAEFDDWSFVVAGDEENLRMTTVASLTPAGRKVWKAGGAKSVAPVGLKRDVAGDAFVSADLSAMIAAAEPHEVEVKRLSNLAEEVQQCGVFCPTFGLYRWPMAALATVSGLAEDDPSLKGLENMAGVHVALVPDGGDVKVAAAFVGRSFHAGGALRGFATEAIGSSLQLHDAVRDGVPVILAGLDVDPRTVFDVEKKGAAAAELASFRWTTSGPMPPRIKPTALTGEMRFAEVALTAELVLGPGAVQFKPDYSGADWSSPVLSGPSSKEADCLVDGVRVMRRAFNAVVTVTEDQRAALATKMVAQLEEPLKCARGDVKLAPLADRLADMAAGIVAESLVDAVDFEAARKLLEARCEGGKKTGLACSRLATLTTHAAPKVAKRPALDRCDEYGLGVPLSVTNSESTLSGTTLPTDAKGIADQLVRSSSLMMRRRSKVDSIDLVVDESTTMKQLGPVLTALASAKADAGVRVVREDDMLVRLGLPIESAKKVAVDWRQGASEEAWAADDEIPEEEPPPFGGSVAGKPGPRHTIKLTAAGMSLVAPDGTSARVASVADLVTLVDALASSAGGIEMEIELRPDPDVLWSDVLDVLAATSCGSIKPILVR
ncbi:MAG: hypothetical protein AAF721_05110 [Myxococcota bacterium]